MDWLGELIQKKLPPHLRCSAYCCILTDEDDLAEYVHDDHVLPAASLIKIPIMIEVFRRRRELHLNCAHAIPIYDAVEGGSFYDRPAGSAATVRELIRHMIVESDNTCANMLMDMVGLDAVNETMASLGLTQTVLRRKMMDFDAARRGEENVTTVRDMGRLFRLLYDGACVDAAYDMEMLDILKNQEDNCILPAQLPHPIAVAHKTGELDGIYHDCGIIYGRPSPMVLCLLTEGITDEPQAIYDLSYLARAIYDHAGKIKTGAV